MRRPSGTSAMPARAIASGERPRTDWPDEAHIAGRRRHDAHDRVQGRRLAGPVRPDQADELAAADLQAEAANGRDRPVQDIQTLELEDSGSPFRSSFRHRALAEVGRRDVEVAADLGRRALRERPALIEDVDPVGDAHHERHVVVDQEDAGVEVLADRAARTSANSCTSGLGQPGRRARPAGRTRGFVASARATPSRRSCPCGSSTGGRVPVERRACSISSPARFRASAGRAPAPSAETSMFSRTVSPRNERLCWNVRAIPARPRLCGLQPVTSRSSRSTLPEVGTSKPVSTLTSVDLPAPFGPIRPDDLVPVQLERDLVQRPHAREGARHGGGPERSPGPPASFRCDCFRQAQIFGTTLAVTAPT